MTEFVHRLRVRYSECDQQNVVFNGHYLFYYDVALGELWRDRICDYAKFVARGFDLVVAEVNLRYRAPARYDDEIDIGMSVRHLGTTSMIVRVEFRLGETLLVDGEVRHVFVDPETLAKKAMPDDVRSILAETA